MISRSCYLKACSWNANGEKGDWPVKSSVPNSTLTPILKRRLSPLGRMALDVVDTTISENMRLVVSSRHGDSDRMARLLNSVYEKTDFSPTDFSLSVHNAIIATHSIHTKNTYMNISLSGAEDSFMLGLIEAYALQVTEGKPVCYVYYDQPMPDFYTCFLAKDKIDVPICIVFMLTSDAANGSDFKLSFKQAGKNMRNKSPRIDLKQLINNFKNNLNEIHMPFACGEFHMERYYE